MSTPCPNCGKPTNIDDKFCGNCGMSLSEIRNSKSESPQKSPVKTKVGSTNNTKDVEENFPSDVYVPDRGFWQKFLKISGRLNPTRFLFRVTLVFATTFFLAIVISLLPLSNELAATLLVPVMFIPAISMVPLMIRRAHDFGRPWWYCFIGGIPILAGVFELVFQKVWYRDRSGDYQENYRLNEAGAVFSFIYIIVAGTLAALYFTFRSGDIGENEYGANPTGKRRANIPVEKNPLLAMISRAEENEHSSLIIIGVIVGLCFGISTIGQFLNNKRPTYATTNIIFNTSKPSPATHIKDTPSQSEQEASSKNSQSEILEKPLTSENQKKAVETLVTFHRSITQRNFNNAYEQLSRDFQYEMNYEGWVVGFDTTISSSVSRVNVISETSSEIFLNYVLTAIDNVQGHEKIVKFNGTVKIINEDGVWKIDEIKNKYM